MFALVWLPLRCLGGETKAERSPLSMTISRMMIGLRRPSLPILTMKPSRTSAAGTNKDKSDKSDKSNTAVTEGGDRDGGEEGASTKGKKGKKGKGTKKAKPSVWEEVFPTKEKKMKKWSS